MSNYRTIDEQEVRAWVNNASGSGVDLAVAWLAEILNGDYSLCAARSDVLSFRKKNDAKESP